MSNQLTLKGLKNLEAHGFLIYTNAQAENKHWRCSDPISVDQMLMNISYTIDPTQDKPGIMTWAFRDDHERLRYHPLSDHDKEMMNRAEVSMHTRIDFFGNSPSDAVHDVTKEFIDNGYDVLVPPLNRILNRLYKFSTGENEMYRVEDLRV